MSPMMNAGLSWKRQRGDSGLKLHDDLIAVDATEKEATAEDIVPVDKKPIIDDQRHDAFDKQTNEYELYPEDLVAEEWLMNLQLMNKKLTLQIEESKGNLPIKGETLLKICYQEGCLMFRQNQ